MTFDFGNILIGIVGGIAASICNTFIKNRLDRSDKANTDLLIFDKFNNYVKILNGKSGNDGVYEGEQIAVIYGLFELYKRHNILKIPIKKALEHANGWNKNENLKAVYAEVLSKIK